MPRTATMRLGFVWLAWQVDDYGQRSAWRLGLSERAARTRSALA